MASAEILKIGASKEVLESRLKTVLPKIHETFDGQVQVIEESDTDVLDAVMSGELDACFTVRGEEDDAFNLSSLLNVSSTGTPFFSNPLIF